MLRNKGITFKLSLYILTGIICIFAAILTIDYQASRKMLMENAKNQASCLAISTVKEIENVLMAAEKIPSNLSPILKNIDCNESSIKQILKSNIENNTEVYGSCVAFSPYSYDSSLLYFAPYYYRKDDSIVYRKLGSDDYQYFFLNWYEIPLKQNKPMWTEPYYDESGGDIIMATYSVPFRKQKFNKQVEGIITVDIDLSWLKQLIGNIRIFDSGYAFLISKKGNFISHPADSLIMHQSIFSLATALNRPDLAEIGKKMTAGETAFIPYQTLNNNIKAWMYYMPFPSNDWSIGIIFPEKELYADIYQLYFLLFSLGLGGIVLVFVLITLIARQITRPLHILALASEDIGAGNFNTQLPPIAGKDEIGCLTIAFMRMQDELKTYIENLRATTAAKNKIESELKIAHDIQQGILPKIFPPFPERDDVDLFAILDPAKEVGGDLYDFFFLSDYHLAFAIGDVSGKGVPASLLMAITRTLFRAKTTFGKSPSQIVSEMNKELCIDNENAMFVTFFLGIIDLKNGEIEFCNAGQNYPYILRENQHTELLRQTHGTPLGLFEHTNYQSGKIKLNKTDTLVLYTDGIPEAMNSKQELLGDAKLEEWLNTMTASQSPKEITNHLLETTRKYVDGAEQSDDITILILSYYFSKINIKPSPMQLEIKNKVSEIHKLETFIEELCAQWKIGREEQQKINLAMEEIVSNIINYGYKDEKEHQINISAHFKNKVVSLRIEDDALAFNPLEHKMNLDLDKPAEERDPGGLGIFFVKKMMDRVEYRYEGNHNILIIEKMIHRQ